MFGKRKVVVILAALVTLTAACVLPGEGIADIGASTPVVAPEAQGSAVEGGALDSTPVVPLPEGAYDVPDEVSDVVEASVFWAEGDAIPEPVKSSCEGDPTQALIFYEDVAYPCAGMVALGYTDDAVGPTIALDSAVAGESMEGISRWQPGYEIPGEVVDECAMTSDIVKWEGADYNCSSIVAFGYFPSGVSKSHCANGDPVVGVTYPWNGNSDSGDLEVYSLTESGLALSGIIPQGYMGKLTGTLSNSSGPSYYHLDFGGNASDVWVKSDSAYCLDEN